MTRCACGNVLGPSVGDVIVFRHPCQCKNPGPHRRRAPQVGLPVSVTRKQYDERKAAGVPVQTDGEKALESEWV